MSKAVLVEASKCVGCWWCYTACKHEHNLPETFRPDSEQPPELSTNLWPTLSTRKIGNEWFFAKRRCMHCEQPGYTYFPHWIEFAISLALVADALLVIRLAHWLLPIVGHEKAVELNVS